MPMQAVGPTKRKSIFSKKASPGGVRSIREKTQIKERIKPRRELPDDLYNEFVAAINSACASGELPYQNYRLDQEGSPNKTLAHYWCHTLDPVYVDTAKKLAQRDHIPFEEAWHYLETRLLKNKMSGLAFILTTDAKKFWYMPAGNYKALDGEVKNNIEPVLYHDWEKKTYTPEEKAMIAKMRKMLLPGKEAELLKELRN